MGRRRAWPGQASACPAERPAWGACDAELDPLVAFATAPKHDRQHNFSSGSGCKPGYDPCLPITGDLDCADVESLGVGAVRVTGTDPPAWMATVTVWAASEQED
jgi:hypothetical protein